ncbi:pro-resilin-like [Palaemon carinicauda]|uniref:pro-resilin-like n=1 Tax=Palaemon carinicauda TaxID=392227 RepID=UPI0035B67F8E
MVDIAQTSSDTPIANMFSKVLLIALGLAALANAAPGFSSESRSFESYESSEAQYSFNYAVKDESSENDFGHQETRDGDNTQGSYYVQLPDGRLQTVKYYVDGDSGYVAEVSYQGEARFPDSFESYESNESK